MKVQLVVADLDGSIVETGKPLSEENTKAVRYLHEKGIKFGIASGRNLFDITRNPERWGLDFDFDIYIGMNGSEVYDTASKKRIDSYKLSSEDLKEIIARMKPMNLNPFIYYRDGMMMKQQDAAALSSAHRNDMKLYIVEDESKMWQEENAKILFRCDPKDCQRIFDFAKSISTDRYKAVRTSPMMIEFVHPLVNKATGLISYCKANNIPMEEVVAFGDTTNDNEMVECCHGVCLANGTDDTKALAKEITERTCREDGFAEWVFKNI